VAVGKALVGLVCAGGLAACATGQPVHRLDIGRLFEVKSTFGSGFLVWTAGPSKVDPRIFAPHKFPRDVAFEPPACANYATGQRLPPRVKGTMAAVTAEGAGNRFVAVAVHTAEQVPFDGVATGSCTHVTFTARTVSGAVDAVGAPQINGADTLGTHRHLEVRVLGNRRSGELYDYFAYFGDFLVMVTANPVTIPNQPSSPVDVERARRLLTDSVAAIRG
jgi:hypothetical protein